MGVIGVVYDRTKGKVELSLTVMAKPDFSCLSPIFEVMGEDYWKLQENYGNLGLWRPQEPPAKMKSPVSRASPVSGRAWSDFGRVAQNFIKDCICATIRNPKQ